MGRDKAGLTHPTGKSFLEVAVERLRTVCDDVAVSNAPGSAYHVPREIVTVEDPIAHRGPIVGVAACVSHARQRGFAACLCTPVDMPDLSVEDLIRLRDIWRRSVKQTVGAVDAASGRLEPLVGIFPTHQCESLQRAAGSKDRSLARWMERHAVERIVLTAGTNRNVNQPEDL
jgi:molybdopterin-guanine dinucleotide biosynthesis protein A